MYAFCRFCQRRLTDEISTTLGYGPDCAAERGLPHGSSRGNRMDGQEELPIPLTGGSL